MPDGATVLVGQTAAEILKDLEGGAASVLLKLDPTGVDVLSEVLRAEAQASGVPVVFSSHQLELVERLCDRVGIVAGGRMVAEGTVGGLRAGAPVDLVVDAPQAPPGWADAIVGVTAAHRTPDGPTVVTLADDAGPDADQAVLDAARATGPVHEFHRRRPALSDLFRDVVGSPEAISA